LSADAFALIIRSNAMKFFGRKAGGETPRPALARAWSVAGGAGLGDWPQGYEAQLVV
jgi:hypothetical protein